MRPLRIGLLGSKGRMGTEVSALLSRDYRERATLEMAVDRGSSAEELMRKSDAEVLATVMSEFALLHPEAQRATLVKSHIVRIPNSVYSARPGIEQYRPDQATPIPNFFLTGDYTQQEFMASIEGSIRSARRVVERIDTAIATGNLS